MYYRNPEAVRRELRVRVLAGYEPSRTIESCEDHATDFFAISAEEFDRIVREAVSAGAMGRPRRERAGDPSRPSAA